MKRFTIRSGVFCVAAALALCGGLAVARPALADDFDADADSSPKTMCPPTQTTMIESKTCPPTSGRPAVIVQRACCTKSSEKGVKTRCKSFPHCPRNSPS